MTNLPICPACGSTFTYQDGALFVCTQCAHDWTQNDISAPQEDLIVHRDSVGNILADGDSVTISKGLKVKGASSGLKAGTKVRNIRLVNDDHNIDCNIEGFGPMKLKSEFVKKV